MAEINKKYEFLPENEALYNIDSYNTSQGSALTLDKNGNVKLRNVSPDRDSDNFYGNGLHGNYIKKDSNGIRPTCGYFASLDPDHEIYGPCLIHCWWSTGSFSPGNEVILHKKHIETEDYIDELGEWCLVTIKEKITDEDGKIHYTLESAPDIEFSTHTANTYTRVLQYKTLEVYNGYTYRINLGTNYVTGNPYWGNRKISTADGILFIKAQESITLGNGSSIQSRTGNTGGRSYAYGDWHYYEGWKNLTYYWYNHGGAPLGCGSINGANGYTTSLLDSRADHPIGPHDNLRGDSPGGMGFNGVYHTANTDFSRAHPVSDDLNDKIYVGVGAGTSHIVKRDSHNYGQIYSGHDYGYTGGGILIIQTPKLNTGTSSNLWAATSGTNSDRGVGYGSGGSILLKIEEINCSNIYNALTTNFSNGAGFIGTGATSTNMGWIGPPGQVQIEFDKWNFSDTSGNLLASLTPTDKENDYIQNALWDNAVIRDRARKSLSTGDNWTDIWEANKDKSKHIENHNYSSPIYETSSWFKIYTQGLHNINIKDWYSLLSTEVFFNRPLGTEIKLLISTDNGQNWLYIGKDTNDDYALFSSSLQNIGTYGNTPEEWNVITDYNFLTSDLLLNQKSESNPTIDIAVGIKTEKSHITPLLDYIWFNYEPYPAIKAPIPLKPGNGEEFNNEDVSFVWLQPEFENGSFQNRIEVSTSTNFDRDTKLITYNRSLPGSDNRISLPYKGAEVDNYNASRTSGYHKTPYLQKRNASIDYIVQTNQASISVDYENGKLTHLGGDYYYRKNKQVITQTNPEIDMPVNSSFLLANNIGSIPQEANLVTHIDMTNLTSRSDAQDRLGFWDLFDVGDTMEVGETLHYNGCFDFVNAATSYIRYGFEADTERTTPYPMAYDSTNLKERTEYVRFKPDNLVLGVNSYIFDHFCGTSNIYVNILSLHKTLVNSIPIIQIRYYTGNAWLYYDIPNVAEGKESVIVIRHTVENKAIIYCNGIRVSPYVEEYISDPATYQSSYHDYSSRNTHQFHINFATSHGRYFTDAVGANKFQGSIYEYAHWDTGLTEEEIVQISRVPVYNLLYNLNTNDLYWKQFPYTDMDPGNTYLEDKVIQIVSAQYSTDINYNMLSNPDGRAYRSTHDELTLAKFSPSWNYEVSYFPEDLQHKIINGIPFRYHHYTNHGWFLADAVSQGTDNGTVMPKTSSSASRMIVGTERIDPTQTDVVVEFIYKDTESTAEQNIVLMTGRASNGRQDQIAYDRYICIKRTTSKVNQVYVAVRHTDGTAYTSLSDSNTPYELKDNHKYMLYLDCGNGVFSDSSAYLMSETDNDYQTPWRFWNGAANSYTPTQYGFATKDFNDKVSGLGYPYTDYAVRLPYAINQDCYEVTALYPRNQFSNVVTSSYEQDFFFEIEVDENISEKLNQIIIRGNDDDPEVNIKTFVSFNNRSTWRVYDASTRSWSTADINDISTGMDIFNTHSINTTAFNNGGYNPAVKTVIRIYLNTINNYKSPNIESVEISYNGPIIIDSWDEPGSFHDVTKTFYFQDTAKWSPYIDVDFDAAAQEWKEAGTGIPSKRDYMVGHGSKTTYLSRKVYMGVKIHLSPKGKYYWRVAAYHADV